MDNHPDIKQIGDARKITQEQLQDIGPINLLLGGPPCDNFSRVNPKRKGFGNIYIHIII